MMGVAREAGYAVEFLGASRDAGLPARDVWEGVPVLRLGRPFPLVNGRQFLTYLTGVLAFWWAAVRYLLQRRPAAIHASDFETGVPALVAGALLRVPVLYNIHDNLAMRYALPGWVMAVLNGMEGIVARRASVTLVPEPFRRDVLPRWARARVHVVRNSPADPGVSEPPPPRPRPTVLFAGWLDVGRGLRQMLTLAAEGHVELVVAGEGDEAIRRDLSATPNVRYLGFCTHHQIMAETAAADYVAAFYDPARTINRYAASNKIAEALAVGRPVLINEELLVARGLAARGTAVVLPYAAIVDRLPALLRAHYGDRPRYLSACRDARACYEADYHATQVRAASLSAFAAAGLDPAWPSTTPRPR
jgi:glycosyltransferase involved in cell wall biosynthesis